MAKEEKKAKKSKEAKEVKAFEGTDDDLIDSLIKDMNSKHDESTMILEIATAAQVTDWVSSGNPVLDAKLGGGYPMGRVVEVFGPESNGKTTVCLHALAETQKRGGVGIFLDTEHALDKRRAKAIGVDLKRLIYAQPGTMEDLFEYVEDIITKIKEKAPDRLVTIVWDSVAATPTRSELEGDYGDAVMAIHARIMSQAFRKITKLISKNKILFMCVNQIRDKVNQSYGDKSATFGGRALKFYSTIRLDVRKIENYKESDSIAGITCVATTKKNKIAPPFQEAKFNILFKDSDAGMDQYTSVLDDGFVLGMFGDKKGYFFYSEKNWRKKELVSHFKENPEEWQRIVDTYLSLV